MSDDTPDPNDFTEWPITKAWAPVVIVIVLIVVALAISGCATLPHQDADPNRVFRYGELQYEDRAGVFVLTEQSLERDDRRRDLVIDGGMPADVKICVDVPLLKGHRERCTTVGALRGGS